MAKKKRQRSRSSPDLDRLGGQIDRFLEGGVDAEAPRDPGMPESDRSQGEHPQPSASDEAPPSGAEDETGAAETARADGESPRFSLNLLDDGLRAAIGTIYPETTEEQIHAFLQSNRVTVGVEPDAIRKALKTAQETGEPVRDVIVARGARPIPPPPPQIEHCPPPGLESLPSLEPIRGLLALEDRAELERNATSTYAWTVIPGDRLAVRSEGEGKPGTGVQGQPIPPPAREDGKEEARVQPGLGVAMGPNGADYIAQCYGCAGLLENQVTVIPPVWITGDGMRACYLNLPLVSGSSPPSYDDLQGTLRAAGVTYGIDDGAVSSLCESLAAGAEKRILVPLASGRPVPAPKDPTPEFTFPHQSQVGAIRPDGSIDFRERALFPSVEKDQLLVEFSPPEPGTPGQTVREEEVPAPDPLEVELVAGENCRVEEGDGGIRIYSETDGGASVQTVQTPTQTGMLDRYTVAVRPVAQISGDINYNTGNIDFKGNVEIRGSVTRGFSVKATGDVTVSDTVEAGAEVTSGGDVTVRQGIVGSETRVKASGNVLVKFIQEAQIDAGANVVVGSYIHGANVKAGGKLNVEGRGGSGGGIVGGEVSALQGIVSRNLGSERSASTQVAAGVDPELHKRYRKASQAVRYADSLLRNLLKAINLPALNSEEIRKLIAKAPARKNVVLHYVKKANQLAEAQEENVKEQKELRVQIINAARHTTVDVTDTAHARVAIRIGDEQIQIQKELKRARFHIDPEGDKAGVFWKDLSGSPGRG